MIALSPWACPRQCPALTPFSMKIDWNATPEDEPYNDEKGEWRRWEGTADGKAAAALLHQDALDRCHRDVTVSFDPNDAVVTDPWNTRNAAPCLEIASRKIRDQYAKTGKMPSVVRVELLDFGPQRPATF